MRQGNNEIDFRATAKCNKSRVENKKSSVNCAMGNPKSGADSETTTKYSIESANRIEWL